jgi:hypothetical protein
MQKLIKIENKNYPVHFGKSFAYRLEEEFKINLAKIQEELEVKPMKILVDIIMAALDEGARVAKKPHNLTKYQILDEWDRNENLMNDIMILFNKGQGVEGEKNIDETNIEST